MILIGETAALATAFLWSMTSIVFAEASKRVGPFYVNITRMFMALTFLIITLLVIGVKVDLSIRQVGYLFISGFAGLILGDTYLFKAYRCIGARLSSLIMASVPPISTFLAFIFLNEKISLIGIFGITITVAGVSLAVFKRSENVSSNAKIDWSGIGYALIGATGQAVGLIFAKFAFNESEVNAFLATFVRVISAVIIIYPLALMTRRFRQPVKVFKNDKRALMFTAIGSILGPFLGVTLSLVSITYAKV